MNKIKMLDISNINCWIINLKPTKENILDFQMKCVNKKVFGIGWSYEGQYNMSGKRYLSNYTDRYIYNYNTYADNARWGYPISSDAVKNMAEVKKGDIVMMRLHNGHFYIGRVCEEAFYDNNIFDEENDNRIMSWMCSVEKWYEYDTDDKLPAEICGRFTQRLQSTITRVDPYRTKLLMISVYEKISGKIIINVPKIHITADNFTRSLNYMDLENLVCKYIYDKHKNDGYMLLPSSGKVSQIKYEFKFVNDNDLPITCQVKNQNSKTINISDYTDDIKQYKYIYIFSGNDNINIDTVAKNIITITRDELYKTLFDFKYLHNKLSLYYTFNQSSQYEQVLKMLQDSGWREYKTFSNNRKSYKISTADKDKNITSKFTRWISLGYSEFFYSEDFDCIIISYQNDITKDMKSLVEELF